MLHTTIIQHYDAYNTEANAFVIFLSDIFVSPRCENQIKLRNILYAISSHMHMSIYHRSWLLSFGKAQPADTVAASWQNRRFRYKMPGCAKNRATFLSKKKKKQKCPAKAPGTGDRAILARLTVLSICDNFTSENRSSLNAALYPFLKDLWFLRIKNIY